MLNRKQVGARFLAILVLALASLNFEMAVAAVPVGPSSGQGYAQYSVNQEPIDNDWKQFNVSLVDDHLQMAFKFDFPAHADFASQTLKAKITFSGSGDKDSSNLLFAKPVKRYQANWDLVLLKALKPLTHHEDGSLITEQEFSDIILNDAAARRLDLTWWNPSESKIIRITLLTDGYDLFGIVTSFNDLGHLHENEQVHHRIVDSIQVLN